MENIVNKSKNMKDKTKNINDNLKKIVEESKNNMGDVETVNVLSDIEEEPSTPTSKL